MDEMYQIGNPQESINVVRFTASTAPDAEPPDCVTVAVTVGADRPHRAQPKGRECG